VLRLAQQARRAFHELGIAERPGLRPVLLGHLQPRRPHVELNVQRDVQEHGPHPAGCRVPERFGDVVGDAPGFPAGPGPLGNGPNERHVIHLLEGSHLQLPERALAPENQHG
jgi:hypothetical protein